MTNEQAIEVLEAVKFILKDYTDEMEEAFGIAINALKAQGQLANKSPKVDKESGELIRRKAAIGVIAKWMLEYGGEGEARERNALKQAAKEIKELLSAHPSPCEFCEHNDVAADEICLRCMAERKTDGRSGQEAGCDGSALSDSLQEG